MISIMIPTYKRLPFLKRAVADVFAQTYDDWELVISDDEEGEGEAWRWISELARREPRVRAVKNVGPQHGQVFNVNNGIAHCRGDWIKILFDDDGMLPECLKKMLAVAERTPSAAMIGCRAQRWRNGVYSGDEKDYARDRLERIPSDLCRLAILKFDRWNGRTPTHMLIRSSIVKNVEPMLDEGGLRLAVDWTWFARILDHGDYVMMKDVLVQQREGEVASLTGGVRDDARSLDNELFIAYKLIYDRLPALLRQGLSWKSVESEINGIRGVYHLCCGHWKWGLCMMVKMFYDLRGVGMFVQWLLQELVPGRFPAIRRVHVE